MARLFPFSRRDADVPVVRTASPVQPPDPGAPSRRPAIIRIVTSVLVVAMLAVFLAAVATNRLPLGATDAPVKGGSIVEGIALEPDTLLPYRTTASFGLLADQAIWAPLWYGDPQGAFHAALAERVPTQGDGISDDLRTWTIHLRSGLKWSDGSPLTAEDCAFSFNLYADPAYGANGFPTTDPADPFGFASATAPDSTTVVLTIKHPYAGLLTLLADGAGTCLPRTVFGATKPAAIARSPENFRPTVTSGPFTIQERVAGDHITVARNPHYYQGPDKPYLDQITFKLLADKDAMLAALQTHAVDTAWFLDSTKLVTYRAIPGYTTYLDRYPAAFEMLVFNMRDPLMGDRAVRQAFTMGFDRRPIISTILNGTGQLTCDDSNGNFAHEESLTCYPFDPVEAGRLLDGDGWTLGTDGYRHKNGQTLALAFATTARLWRKKIQDLAKAELQTIGMKLDLKTYADADYWCGGSTCVLAGGHFQIAELASGNSYDPDDHAFFSADQTPDKGGANFMRYTNPEVDQQERIQQNTTDSTARKDAFHIIHQDVLRDLPVMYLFTPQNVACARSDLHNYNPSALGPEETWNVWDWWLAPHHT